MAARLAGPARAAYGKAAAFLRDQHPTRTGWANGGWVYRIGSRTTPGQFYYLWRVARPRSRWWFDRWQCSCKAFTTGKYAICWHRAALHLVFLAQYPR